MIETGDESQSVCLQSEGSGTDVTPTPNFQPLLINVEDYGAISKT